MMLIPRFKLNYCFQNPTGYAISAVPTQQLFLKSRRKRNFRGSKSTTVFKTPQDMQFPRFQQVNYCFEIPQDMQFPRFVINYYVQNPAVHVHSAVRTQLLFWKSRRKQIFRGSTSTSMVKIPHNIHFPRFMINYCV
jgi:hypothetical protein